MSELSGICHDHGQSVVTTFSHIMGTKGHKMESKNCHIWNGKHLQDGPPHWPMLMSILETKQREGVGWKDLVKTRGSILGMLATSIPFLCSVCRANGKVTDRLVRGSRQESRTQGPQGMMASGMMVSLRPMRTSVLLDTWKIGQVSVGWLLRSEDPSPLQSSLFGRNPQNFLQL